MKFVAGALSNGARLAWSARYPRYHTIVGRELMLDRMLQATNAQRPRQTRRIAAFFSYDQGGNFPSLPQLCGNWFFE